MVIGALRGAADTVLPAARAATVELAVLDLFRATAHVSTVTSRAAAVTAWRVTERVGGRWE